MPRVKVTGNGEIEEVVRGKVYKIRHHLGKDPETGKYKRSPKRTVYGTKSKAREELAKYKVELEGGYGNPDKVTLGEYANEWFKRRELSDRYSPETIKTDRRHLKRIVEMFGGALVNDIDASDISRAYAARRDSGEMSASTVHNVHVIFNQLMESAKRDRLIATNPCELVDAPRPKPKERKSFELDDALRLAKAIKESDRTGKTVAVWLALATGVRRGEALGLTWRHVDFERKRIFIAQQYANDRELRDPKSEKSQRWIGIDDGTVAFLQEWKRIQARMMEVDGMKLGPGTPVCENELHGFMDPNTFSRWRRAFFAEHGLGHFEHEEEYVDSQGRRRIRRTGYVGYNFHELRHTQATLLIGQGADVKTVQHRLGHSSASLTMNIYAHAIAQNDEQAAMAIGDILGSGAAPEEFENACNTVFDAVGPLKSAKGICGCWVFEVDGRNPVGFVPGTGDIVDIDVSSLVDADAKGRAVAAVLGTEPRELLTAMLSPVTRQLAIPRRFTAEGALE